MKKVNPFQLRNFVIPVVEQKITYGIGSDCYPATIVEVSKDLTRIKFQMDTVDENGQIVRNLNGSIREYTLRNRNGEGVWIAKGLSKPVGYISFKGWDFHLDPSF